MFFPLLLLLQTRMFLFSNESSNHWLINTLFQSRFIIITKTKNDQQKNTPDSCWRTGYTGILSSLQDNKVKNDSVWSRSASEENTCVTNRDRTSNGTCRAQCMTNTCCSTSLATVYAYVCCVMLWIWQTVLIGECASVCARTYAAPSLPLSVYASADVVENVRQLAAKMRACACVLELDGASVFYECALVGGVGGV